MLWVLQTNQSDQERKETRELEITPTNSGHYERGANNHGNRVEKRVKPGGLQRETAKLECVAAHDRVERLKLKQIKERVSILVTPNHAF